MQNSVEQDFPPIHLGLSTRSPLKNLHFSCLNNGNVIVCVPIVLTIVTKKAIYAQT